MTNAEHDLNKVWAAMLDDHVPPLPSAQETLAAARRTSRRRTAFTTAWSGLAVGVTIAAVAAGTTLASTGKATPAPAVPNPIGAPPAQQQPLPIAPTRDAAHAHGAQSGAVLVAAVPTGYTGLLEQLSTDSPASTWQFPDPAQYSSGIDVVITTGQADGLLSADIRGGLTNLGDDLCSTAITDILKPDLTGCDIITVNGIPIRTSTTHDQDRGDTNTAVRLLNGGLLILQVQQAIPDHRTDDTLPPDANVQPPHGQHTILGGWPALPAVPITTTQLATIAANPDLLP